MSVKKIFTDDEINALIRVAKAMGHDLMAEKGEPYEEAYIHVAKFVMHTVHEGQELKGKTGGPFETHPVHVGDVLREPIDKQIGYLHDVCEMSNLTSEHLGMMGFHEQVAPNVNVLTISEDDEYYLDYIVEVGQWRRARRVKLEDLRHNTQHDREVPGVFNEKKHWKRESYRFAIAYLEAIERGETKPGTDITYYICNSGFLDHMKDLQGEALEMEIYALKQILIKMSSNPFRQHNLENALRHMGIVRSFSAPSPSASLNSDPYP